MPDPSFESGVSLQREYLDISNPDNGIFLDRSYKMPGGDNDEYRELCDRMLVVSSDDLAIFSSSPMVLPSSRATLCLISIAVYLSRCQIAWASTMTPA